MLAVRPPPPCAPRLRGRVAPAIAPPVSPATWAASPLPAAPRWSMDSLHSSACMCGENINYLNFHPAAYVSLAPAVHRPRIAPVTSPTCSRPIGTCSGLTSSTCSRLTSPRTPPAPVRDRSSFRRLWQLLLRRGSLSGCVVDRRDRGLGSRFNRLMTYRL